jgi:hypothetical protein
VIHSSADELKYQMLAKVFPAVVVECQNLAEVFLYQEILEAVEQTYLAIVLVPYT